MSKAGWRDSFFDLSLLVAALTAFMAAGSRADLFVSSQNYNIVVQYDDNSGDFLSIFASGGGLSGPRGVLFGPDGNFYVASNGSPNGIVRFDAAGNFLDNFVLSAGELSAPRGIIFGRDGNLYVSSKNTNSINRYDGMTGQLIDIFVSPGLGGLSQPMGLVFGPDGNLYVSSFNSNQVLRYDGATGGFIDVFALDGLTNPQGLTFGPDGNLYVATGDPTPASVLRYNPSGQFMDVFVHPDATGGLADPNGIVFGPDGNLYVGDQNDVAGISGGGVFRYDGNTGAFIDNFVPAQGGVISPATYLTFTKTDPTTLQSICASTRSHRTSRGVSSSITAASP
jgi:sugar lactone lactonase YvrE